MFNLNSYKVVEENLLRVKGEEFQVEDTTTGEIYVTEKTYIDKLFDEMGYKNLNVIKIIAKFAGKFVTEIGQLKKSKVFVDPTTSSFIVANPDAVSALDKLDSELVGDGFSVTMENSNRCLANKEYLISSPNRTYFSIRVNLSKETVEILSLHINEAGITDGIMYEGEYKLMDYGVVDSIMTLLNSNINAAAYVRPDEKVSLHEYVELLKGMGLAKLNRRTNIVHLTDTGSAIAGSVMGEDIAEKVSDYNAFNWLKRHLTDSGKTYGECFTFASQFPEISPWNIHEFYSNNINEANDFTLLK